MNCCDCKRSDKPREPLKRLDCAHTVCQDCLRRMLNLPGDNIKCPICEVKQARRRMKEFQNVKWRIPKKGQAIGGRKTRDDWLIEMRQETSRSIEPQTPPRASPIIAETESTSIQGQLLSKRKPSEHSSSKQPTKPGLLESVAPVRRMAKKTATAPAKVLRKVRPPSSVPRGKSANKQSHNQPAKSAQPAREGVIKIDMSDAEPAPPKKKRRAPSAAPKPKSQTQQPAKNSVITDEESLSAKKVKTALAAFGSQPPGILVLGDCYNLPAVQSFGANFGSSKSN